MGWASGSSLFADVIPVIERYVPKKYREDVYLELIAAFTEYYWDTLDECLGKSKYYDEAYKEWYLD